MCATVALELFIMKFASYSIDLILQKRCYGGTGLMLAESKGCHTLISNEVLTSFIQGRCMNVHTVHGQRQPISL